MSTLRLTSQLVQAGGQRGKRVSWPGQGEGGNVPRVEREALLCGLLSAAAI